ncbi:MAG: hypothetical protein C4617_05250 [Candidatus Liberibacter europaeus]|uniref:Antitoxin SocA-like Panacea domain-containing protein n=1 Tax=Candidatus Liberibacter europaeus TaxID=744859 RepID=A0A2T4VWG8_9HYPH|nr:hypothetical protein [Candidatus Liberibacter europaeus]PTL86116.1 MAG: hypothetical protein C4617_05250 [Candidatus Liberibacter europaeus]
MINMIIHIIFYYHKNHVKSNGYIDPTPDSGFVDSTAFSSKQPRTFFESKTIRPHLDKSMRTSKENARYRMESEPPFTCLAMANFFIDQGVRYDSPVTNLKLQSLLYFTYCILVLRHKQAMLDEEPQAWRNGPVFSGIYHRFKYFGKGTIRFPMDLAFDIFPVIKDKDVLNIMKMVWEIFGIYSDKILSGTSRTSIAWKKVYNPKDQDLIRTITVEHILKHEQHSFLNYY